MLRGKKPTTRITTRIEDELNELSGVRRGGETKMMEEWRRGDGNIGL